MRVAWVAVLALFMSGCAGSAPPAADASDAPAGVAPTLAAVPVPLRFASGDFESLYGDEATFAATDICNPQCSGNAVQMIDLTDAIPAEAPVELSVSVRHDGSIRASLVFEDADPVQIDQPNSGGGFGGGGSNTQISALVTRAPAGTVQLRLTHQMSFPPKADAVTATIEVRSVVRADTLVSSMPTKVTLDPGAILNFTNGDLDRVAMFLDDGTVLYDVDGPFTLTVPETARGPVTIMVVGGSTQVEGPNTTMTARRVEVVPGDSKDIANGGETAMSLTAAKPPLLVGVSISRKPTYEFVSAAPILGTYTVTITTPNNVVVLDETASCDLPVCEFSPFAFSGDTIPALESDFMDEYLVPGAYSIVISAAQSNNYQAMPYYLQIAE